MTRPSSSAVPLHDVVPAVPARLALLEGTRPTYVAQLRFALPRNTPVIALVFDAAGQLVRSLCEGEKPAGEHVCAWDGFDSAGRRLPAGSYRLTLEAAGRTLVTRIVTLC